MLSCESRLLGVMAALVLVGCPYESKVSVGTRLEQTVDVTLCGEWIGEKNGDGTSWMLMTVLPFNESEYFVEGAYEDGKRGRMRAVPTMIGKHVVIVVNPLGSLKPEGFIFVRYVIDGSGRLVLRLVGGDKVPLKLKEDQEGLTDYLSSRLDGSELDDPDGPYTFRRARKDEVEDGTLRIWKHRGK